MQRRYQWASKISGEALAIGKERVESIWDEDVLEEIMADKRQGTILLADDDCQNAMLIRLAFRKAGFENPIHAVEQGQDAIQYLTGEGEYKDRAKFALPELILLDTNLRGVSGWEVLRWLRQQPQFANLAVVVFTGSEDPTHKEMAERLGANGYEIKPHEFDVFVQALKRIGERWLGISESPQTPGNN